MAATVQTDGGKFTVIGRKPVWGSLPPYFTSTSALVRRNYDLSPDGQRFIVLKDAKPAGAAESAEQIFLVQNWTEELKRRVPGARKRAESWTRRPASWIVASGTGPASWIDEKPLRRDASATTGRTGAKPHATTAPRPFEFSISFGITKRHSACVW